MRCRVHVSEPRIAPSLARMYPCTVFDPAHARACGAQAVQPFLACIFMFTMTSLLPQRIWAAMLRYGIMVLSATLFSAAYSTTLQALEGDTAVSELVAQSTGQVPRLCQLPEWDGASVVCFNTC